MTMDENISWSELLKNPNLTAEHGNDGNRIAMATESLNQTAHQFVEVLNERARIIANSAQFDTALRDAAAIRAILPGSGLGYLRMGDVYCQQGRYAAAISIYDQGIETVPGSDAYYQPLVQRRMTAVANNSKRVDFISRLPLDIVITNILPRMNATNVRSRELYEPLYVSRGWQKRILQQPNGLDINFGDEDHTFKRGHDQLVRFAPYVQSLSGAITDGVHLDELFSRARFSNLKHLDVDCDNLIPRRPLLNSLRLIADSLTHLSLRVCTYIQLRDILELCPNLVSLNAEDVAVVTPSSPSLRYPKMAHLGLVSFVSEKDLDYDDVMDALSRFPSLLSFEVSPLSDSKLLTVLHEHCPRLQRLHYGGGYLGPGEFDFHPSRQGVTSVHFYGRVVYHQDDLIKFLHMNQHSLETITFVGPIDQANCNWRLQHDKVVSNGAGDVDLPSSENDPTQSQTLFTQLASIDYLPYTGTRNDLMKWMTLNAPNLKDICIPDSSLQVDMADAMARSDHLSKLTIKQMTGDHDFGGITKFLELHIAKEGLSTLEEMTLHINTGIHHVTWLPLIARLKCLKILELLALDVHNEAKPILVALGQGCPALEKLTLGKSCARFADGLIKPLCTLPNLKHLRIGATLLSQPDLFALIEFPKLERLDLYYAVPDKNIMEMLRSRIQKVVII